MILVLFSYACLAAIADMRQIASTFLAQAKEDRAADRAMIFQLASSRRIRSPVSALTPRG
jgi:hypothetical protein